ncbi:protein AKNAD1 isoform X3 [Apus apus]|uniref:protein AKNAD1 isoform X3 n=1 Tax=Apus apus TaxID=8895 RepID=UPI0021F819A4|nr:protein AKNAD1 isoform X3 [Apus apus]
METTKKYELSDWMKTHMNSSFSDELGCITDATDEEQDGLPYDEDVGITCKYNNSDNLNNCICRKAISGILNLACSEDNVKATANYETHPQPEEFLGHFRGAIGLTAVSVERPGREASFKEELRVGGFSEPDSKEHPPNSKMSNVFLRHFSKGELISTHQLIEYETIPETSITESINDTVNKPEPSEHDQGPAAHEQRAASFEEDHSDMQEEVNTSDKNQNSLNENRCISKKPISSTGKCVGRQDNSQLIYENEDTHIFQNMKEEKDLFKKTVSPHELKYDQGQAHYCLADFSKAASEVKVPKRCDNINSVPTTEQPKSFPILLSKSLNVNNILENNYFNSAHIENQEEISPELLQQLEVLPQLHFSHGSIDINSGDTGTSSEVFALHAPILPQSTYGLQCGSTVSALPVEAHCLNPSNLLPELTLGEKMSQMLKDQTDELIKEVEDFSKHMTQETFLLQDNYPALDQLKRYRDALERNYLTAREQHRRLQLQNYKDKSINVGEFDPERKVEGEIFRLGMLLDDIQEQTDDSKSNLSSLITSYESAHSSYSLCESSEVSSPADPAEGRGIGTAFVHKKKEETSQTTDVIPQTNQLSLKSDKCNICLYINTSIQEKKTATCSLFIQRKPTDLSDTNLSSDSEDISAYDSCKNSQSEELGNCESYRILNTRICGERKAYSQKRKSTQKAQKSKQPSELVNRLSERQNLETAKTCYSNTYDKIILAHQYLPSKKSAQSKSTINIRNRNADYSNANMLSSTLDHAIQTANSLKKATERMKSFYTTRTDKTFCYPGSPSEPAVLGLTAKA